MAAPSNAIINIDVYYFVKNYSIMDNSIIAAYILSTVSWNADRNWLLQLVVRVISITVTVVIIIRWRRINLDLDDKTG